MEDTSRNMMQGTITNMETGETIEVNHFLFPNDAKISAIVRVEKVEDYVYEDESMQVSIDCQALCSNGFVFELKMEFFPETAEKKERILRDMVVSSLFFVEGRYSVLCEEAAIIIYDAEYHPVDEGLEKVARDTFKVNSGRVEG